MLLLLSLDNSVRSKAKNMFITFSKNKQSRRKEFLPQRPKLLIILVQLTTAAAYSAATLLVFWSLLVGFVFFSFSSARPSKLRNAELRLRFGSALGMNSLGMVLMK